jgi:hypothetical protein
MSSAASEGELELSVPADPALALTARMFAGALAEHLGDDVSADDLKLAFSELLAAGVDAGSDSVAYRVDLGAAEIVVRGAGAIGDTGQPDVEEHERFARAHRADLLGALFPHVRTEGDLIRLPIGHE